MRRLYTLSLLVFLLAACAGETPKMVASAPRSQQPIAAAPLDAVVVYHAVLDLAVRDVSAAADQAAQAAYDNGGYLVSAHSWQSDGKTYAAITLTAPAYNFDPLRRALLRLGSLDSERVTGDLAAYGRDGRVNYSQITLNLRPAETFTIAWPDIHWNPSATLHSAFAVFLTIFGFLVDILIWALVVIGPFALLALGLRAAARRAVKR